MRSAQWIGAQLRAARAPLCHDRRGAGESTPNPAEAAENLRSYGVSFEEAATVLGDQFARTYEDPDASQTEARELTFGLPRAGRALVVTHCERRNRTRIISAREMTRREKRDYQEGSEQEAEWAPKGVRPEGAQRWRSRQVLPTLRSRHQPGALGSRRRGRVPEREGRERSPARPGKRREQASSSIPPGEAA